MVLSLLACDTATSPRASDGPPATLTVTEVPAPPAGPTVRVSQLRRDETGPTSMRYYAPRTGAPTKVDDWAYGGRGEGDVRYYFRDRDLGQVFTTGSEGFRLGALTVRLQPVDVAEADPSGAAVSLQLFRVEGQPVVDDNGTADYAANAHRVDTEGLTAVAANDTSTWAGGGAYVGPVTNPRWSTYASDWPEDPADAHSPYRWPVMHYSDDFLTGERYVPLAIARGAVVPGGIDTDDYLRWEIDGGGAAWTLEPDTRYAFLLLFDEPAAPGVKRNLPLSNINVLPGGRTADVFPGGHMIRREGATTEPDEVFIRDTTDAADVEASRRSASFPVAADGTPDFAARAAIAPGTLGYPDVDTYRDMWFVLEGEPTKEN